MDELLTQFLIEGPDLVQQGSDALLQLDRQPGDKITIDDAFRAIHTLKGSAGLFDLPPMAAVLHAAEDALGAMRDGKRAIDSATIDRLLAALTQTEKWLQALENSGDLPENAAAAAERLIQLLFAPGAQPIDRQAPEPVPDKELSDWVASLGEDLPSPAGAAATLVAIRYVPDPGCYFSGDDPIGIVANVPGLVHLRLGLRPADNAEGPYDPFTCRLIIEAASSATLDEIRSVFRFVADQVSFATIVGPRGPVPARPADARSPEPGARALRIEPERIEALAAVVEELVTVKNGLAGVVTLAKNAADAGAVAAGLATQYGSLDRLVAQLHQRVMSLRMVPVTPLLRRLPRVVREMAAGVDKDVDLVIEKSDVEADKNVIEGLLEPLTHLLRNAVDHGVENRATRLERGKPPKAVITLSARESGGQLHIRLHDDGRGIDPSDMRAVAVRRSLMDAERLRTLTDQEAIELIFLPGFSTAETVTSLSGRGVGMDVVRTSVQRLGGRVAVASEIGVGTEVSLVLPLNVTLTKVMVVSDAGERYGVPMDQVLETLRVPAAQVVPIRAGHAFNWRDKTVPLLPLSSLTGLADGASGIGDGDQKVLIVRSGDRFAGLAIGSIDDRLDVAMRPLDGLLAGMRGVAGTTTLGDGHILMILDPEVLVE